MAKNLHLRLLFVTLGASLSALGYGAIRAYADGPPTSQPLWYAGTVSDIGGAPLEGSHMVSMRLLDSNGRTFPCIATPTAVAFVKGRFRVDASSCLDSVKGTPDLSAELTVDAQVFPASKIGAVPYAIEAGRAPAAGVPAGAIMMFAQACPAGFMEYAAMRGRFPRGEQASGPLDRGGSDDAVVVAHSHPAGGLSTAAAGSHSHTVPCSYTVAATHSHSANGGSLAEAPSRDSSPGTCNPIPATSEAANHTHSIAGATASFGETGAGKNLPSYQEVVFCIKQ